MQRKEYEQIVKRHLGFIDKVIQEKQALTEKSQGLSEQVKSLQLDYQSKQQGIADSHSREMKNMKDMLLAAEKVKREKYVQEKTRSIKEATIKSLEPEIQSLIAGHKVQLRQVEDNYHERVSKEKAQLNEMHQRQIVYNIDPASDG